jgi:hypothetical protein
VFYKSANQYCETRGWEFVLHDMQSQDVDDHDASEVENDLEPYGLENDPRSSEAEDDFETDEVEDGFSAQSVKFYFWKTKNNGEDDRNKGKRKRESMKRVNMGIFHLLRHGILEVPEEDVDIMRKDWTWD